MKLEKLTEWISRYLEIERFAQADLSMNGLQIGRSGAEIETVAFAVDACRETLERAAAVGAQMLFAHHGLFWGSPLAVTGSHYTRIAAALKHDVALYAAHLPLDAHPKVGNNAVMADLLGLEDRQPFGLYHGVSIGVTGKLPAPARMEEIRRKLGFSERVLQLPFGRTNEISTVAIVSGGAASSVTEAIEGGTDLFITGELVHQIYHQCLEERINVLAGGHYDTEVFGPKAMAAAIERELGLKTQFLDVPTGL